MQTLLFVDNGIPFQCGFQLNRHNWFYAPRGRIHVARYRTAFMPDYGLGYYGDIYMKRFIRRWKNYVVVAKRRKMEKQMALLCISGKRIGNENLLRYINDYL